MGFYDTVTVCDPRFVCSEGHDLCQEEFQTKDLGGTMGTARIEPALDGAHGIGSVGSKMRLTVESGEWGESPRLPFLGILLVYCHCTKCPAFVQAGTGNLAAVSVEFEVEVISNAIRNIMRVSASTAEFLETKPKQPYMAGCEGPMSYAAAHKRHVEYPRERRSGVLVADLSADVLEPLWSPAVRKSPVELKLVHVDLGRPIDDTIPPPIRTRARGRRFSFGSPEWPGVAKLNEECGETVQIIGKLMNFEGDGLEHWDGTNLRDEFMNEVADVQAATAFVVAHCDLDAGYIAERVQRKLALFEKWHIEQADKTGKPNQIDKESD